MSTSTRRTGDDGSSGCSPFATEFAVADTSGRSLDGRRQHGHFLPCRSERPVMGTPLSIWPLNSLGIVAAASLFALISSCIHGFAQAGSAGGTIGKQDKSISGDQEVRSSSPGARKNTSTRAARTNERAGSACEGIPVNITGTWNSSSPSSVSEDVRQTGCNFVATLSAPFFHHVITGRHLGGSDFSLKVVRTNQTTGCTTVMLGSVTVISGSQMQWIVTGTDGKCDLSANYKETRMWTR
jgi:hypothetical protein